MATTSSGVPPLWAILSTSRESTSGIFSRGRSMKRSAASTAPLRYTWPFQSTPDRRVSALKAIGVSSSRRGSWIGCRMRRYSTIDLPSGVSSASEASNAPSASSLPLTPGAAYSALQRRLPKVMVPVLSSSSTWTSPAASTARPDLAITFRRTRRSMPAMPMAESRPPMVVGISVTSSATRNTSGRLPPANRANGLRVTTTSRKIRVRPISRMSSATSLGVFCRLAPSTRAIIRSRVDSPGLAPIRTSSQSDTTWVLPVTAERSPPDSRITGADSPVMAASLTAATPSMTSPSPGIISPAWTRTTSPLRRLLATTLSKLPSARRLLAERPWLPALRLSARALPRPSASASAKLAKSTVNHSQRAICSATEVGTAWSGTKHSKVVSTAVSSTTSITGERSNWRGSSLTKACSSAGRHKAARLVDALWRRSSDLCKAFLDA
ncbi:hypothetical protein ALP65_04651 [Pseudomonas aeruginosa]|uniref:Uncharacterized protein n=1 Tax=Pseudomonas aeruginosa TaxID=287 RepID=A0A3M5DT17_PSEAI|nr:hypothetical protein ALP65_04651 [Pseudomonas aeruginosa]